MLQSETTEDECRIVLAQTEANLERKKGENDGRQEFFSWQRLFRCVLFNKLNKNDREIANPLNNIYLCRKLNAKPNGLS